VSYPPYLNAIAKGVCHASYFDIIKEPMDLSTMSAKLEAGMYKDRFAFEADFRLILSNAKKYNLPGSHVHNETLAIESFFEKRRSSSCGSTRNINIILTQNGRAYKRHWKLLIAQPNIRHQQLNRRISFYRLLKHPPPRLHRLASSSRSLRTMLVKPRNLQLRKRDLEDRNLSTFLHPLT
jgi:hypothetical protein